MPRLSPAPAKQRQQHDSDGVEQQQTVATTGIADAHAAQAHAEAKILRVPEPGLYGPTPRVHVDDLARRRCAVARGEMPSVLHVLGLDADHRADLLLGRLAARLCERLTDNGDRER